MHLLIVHREEQIGQVLQTMVQEYTAHTADYVRSDRAAIEWAEEAAECELLLTQLEGEGVDGLTIAGSLGKRFPRLHTCFLPAYPRDAQRLEVVNTKIFPEPIDGERLLQAIERVASAVGAPDLFHLIDLVQMCCLSGKSGGVQLVAESESGLVYLRNGELRHAETAGARGLEAIYEMIHWGPIEFAYDGEASSAEQSIDIGWDAALIELVIRAREEPRMLSRTEPGSAIELEIATATHQSEPDLSGQQFGPYRVRRKLTESFWANVYEAEQTAIGRSVALHILRRSLRENPERAEAFLAGASANANIRHPAILPVYEAGEYGGACFYAREFIVGRTLYQIVTSGLTITERTALGIVRAIAGALSHLEDNDILHAPLRLSRIFVTPNDETKLADLAVASPAMAQLAPAQSEIQMIGRVLIPMTHPTAMPGSGRVLRLLDQMQNSDQRAITTWGELADEANKLAAVFQPFSAFLSPKKTGVREQVRFRSR
jgi:CheY-like chemotaxis protein